RVFLLNSVHENEPAIFQTRWTLSYLRGPMTRENIKVLTAAGAAVKSSELPSPETSQPLAPPPIAAGVVRDSQPPLLPPGIAAYYLPPEEPGPGLEYYPAVLGSLNIHFTSGSICPGAWPTRRPWPKGRFPWIGTRPSRWPWTPPN
nr:hypothetical protein [Desulfobacterales bacterium]